MSIVNPGSKRVHMKQGVQYEDDGSDCQYKDTSCDACDESACIGTIGLVLHVFMGQPKCYFFKEYILRFEVLTVVNVKISIIRDVTPSSLQMHTDVQTKLLRPFLGQISTKMEATGCTKTLLHGNHITEDSNLNALPDLLKE